MAKETTKAISIKGVNVRTWRAFVQRCKDEGHIVGPALSKALEIALSQPKGGIVGR